MATPTPIVPGDHALIIDQEIRVHASIDATFAALLDQLGPNFSTPDGTSMQLKLEAFPGGRWYRDLGNSDGHFWAHVQAIKRPTLLELTGPVMMSHPVSNNIQYRLKEEGGTTLITFHHYGFGVIPAQFHANMPDGWQMILARIQSQAEL